MADLLEILQDPGSYSRYTPSADDFVDFTRNLINEGSTPIAEDSELLWYGEGGATFIDGPKFSKESILQNAFSHLVSDHQNAKIGSNAPNPLYANITTDSIHAARHTVGFPLLKYINADTIHLSEGKYIELTDTEIHIYPGSNLTRLKLNMGGNYRHGINRYVDSNLAAGKIKYANATNQGCILGLLNKGVDSEYTSYQFTKLVQKT